MPRPGSYGETQGVTGEEPAVKRGGNDERQREAGRTGSACSHRSARRRYRHRVQPRPGTTGQLAEHRGAFLTSARLSGWPRPASRSDVTSIASMMPGRAWTAVDRIAEAYLDHSAALDPVAATDVGIPATITGCPVWTRRGTTRVRTCAGGLSRPLPPRNRPTRTTALLRPRCVSSSRPPRSCTARPRT